MAKFTEMFPAAKDTGFQIAVRGPQGNTLPYTILSLTHPPAKIDGAGSVRGGLVALESGGRQNRASSLPRDFIAVCDESARHAGAVPAFRFLLT